MSERFIGMAIMGIIYGTYGFFKGLRDMKFKRFIEDTPTSKVRSLAMGFVELKGKARLNESFLKSPLSDSDCVLFDVIIEQKVSNKHGGEWQKIYQKKSAKCFYLDDSTGRVLVNPKHVRKHLQYSTYRQGNVRLPKRVKEILRAKRKPVTGIFKKTYRCREILIKEGEPLFVLGTTKKVDGVVQIAKGACKYSYIADKKEEHLISQLNSFLKLKLFGGPILAVLCILFILIYFKWL